MSASLRPPKRSKDEAEEFLVREFLARIGVADAQIEKRESPDFVIGYVLDGAPRAVGIELTEYHIDQGPKGGSPRRKTAELEERIWELAHRHCVAAFPDLARLEGRLRLDPPDLPKKSDVGLVAQQLADFLMSKRGRIDSDARCFTRQAGDFVSFPLLQQHVVSVRAYVLSPTGRPIFQHGGAAPAATRGDVLVTMLGRKTNARASFDCSGMDECWLVIVASGATLGARAGPAALRRARLDSPDVREAARASGFHRVYFWERARRWHELLYSADQSSER